MSQVKVYGMDKHINNIKEPLCDVIHSCIVDAFQFPKDKMFYRFFPLSKDNFYYPNGRTEKYTIIEISIFEGRSTESKKKLIQLLFDRLKKHLHISNKDIEITIFETPRSNWGIRGLPGDELILNYKVEI